MKRKKSSLCVHILYRMLFGVAAVYLVNLIFRSQDYVVSVGINIVTAFTIALLGLPGILLLFGLAIYFSF